METENLLGVGFFMSKIRIWLNQKLEKGTLLSLKSEQVHYLHTVMRCKVGGIVNLFNKNDGEWICEIEGISKRHTSLRVQKCHKKFVSRMGPKFCLTCSLIKSVTSNFLVQKATELGVNEFFPIICDRTVVNKINLERARKSAIEATEQCGRLDILEIKDIEYFEYFLKDRNERDLIVCGVTEREKMSFGFYTTQMSCETIQNLCKHGFENIFVMTGPEGGFSTRELNILSGLNNVYPLQLSELTLRAETADMSLLSVVRFILDNGFNY